MKQIDNEAEEGEGLRVRSRSSVVVVLPEMILGVLDLVENGVRRVSFGRYWLGGDERGERTGRWHLFFQLDGGTVEDDDEN